MTDIAIAIVAGIGAYLGSVIALSKRSSKMIAPDATAQAYRDAITALGDLRQAVSKVDLGRRGDRDPVTDDLRSTFDRAYSHLGGIKASTAFLLSQGDFEAIHNVLESYRSDQRGEWIVAIDKAVDVLQRSAFRMFPSRN